jgi:hypothetical protein
MATGSWKMFDLPADPHVLHLHETRDAALIAEFQANAMSHAPS